MCCAYLHIIQLSFDIHCRYYRRPAILTLTTNAAASTTSCNQPQQNCVSARIQLSGTHIHYACSCLECTSVMHTAVWNAHPLCMQLSGMHLHYAYSCLECTSIMHAAVWNAHPSCMQLSGMHIHHAYSCLECTSIMHAAVWNAHPLCMQLSGTHIHHAYSCLECTSILHAAYPKCSIVVHAWYMKCNAQTRCTRRCTSAPCGCRQCCKSHAQWDVCGLLHAVKYKCCAPGQIWPASCKLLTGCLVACAT